MNKTTKHEPMRQQVNAFLVLDANAELPREVLEQQINDAIGVLDSSSIELLRLALYEEANIAGHSPVCEDLSDALGKALDWIAELTADDTEEVAQDNEARWKRIQTVYAKNSLPDQPNSPTNQERAEHAGNAITEYLSSKGGAWDEPAYPVEIIDLISDLLHHAHRLGFNTEHIHRLALTHFQYETQAD